LITNLRNKIINYYIMRKMTHMEKIAIFGKLRGAKNLMQNLGGDLKTLRLGLGDVAAGISRPVDPIKGLQEIAGARPMLKDMMSTNFGKQLTQRSALIPRALLRFDQKPSTRLAGVQFKYVADILKALGRDIKGL
jgi:hypothetical protein